MAGHIGVEPTDFRLIDDAKCCAIDDYILELKMTIKSIPKTVSERSYLMHSKSLFKTRLGDNRCLGTLFC